MTGFFILCIIKQKRLEEKSDVWVEDCSAAYEPDALLMEKVHWERF